MNESEWQALRPCVRRMAKMMQLKLEKNRHKDGVDTDSAYLESKLKEEVKELLHSTNDTVWGEAADVANMAMIIACYDTAEEWWR